MVGSIFRVFISRGACIAFCSLLCIWLCRVVYLVSCVCFVWGVVLVRIGGLGVCPCPG